MNNLYKNVKFGGTAVVVLFAASFGTAYGQNNAKTQPDGQGGTQTTTNVVVTNTPNVVVTNTPAQPLVVKELNDPSAQPFQVTVQPYISAGQMYNYAFIQVPAGKRLVIEQVSGFASASGALSGTVPRLQVTGGVASSPNVFVPMTFAGNNPGNGPMFAATQQMRMYADGGTSIGVSVLRSADINGNYSGTVSSSISIVGYLVNLP